ncbi:MAG: hypothetical protein U9P79_04170 [Candidatus Cloacimonadota bacterium]|nr:hypothetical protein [Candidatus Cloacimonadota bacterium]
MGSLLDAIGAVAIGGILLVSMITTLYMMQANGNNLNSLITLMQISEDVSSAIDSLYLSKVGLGVTSSSPIVATSSNSFEFLTKNPVTNLTDTIKIIQESADVWGYPLSVYRNSVLELGPFSLKDSLDFIFYDRSETVTTTVDSIRSVKMTAEFTSPAIPTTSSLVNVNNKIIIWRYFKNLYI